MKTGHRSRSREGEMRGALIITGSRSGHPDVEGVLDFIKSTGELDVLILGCATGVDRQALNWALENDTFFVVFCADWQQFRRSAVAKRNSRMVQTGRFWGAWCVGFPSVLSLETYNCLRQAERAGLKTLVLQLPPECTDNETR